MYQLDRTHAPFVLHTISGELNDSDLKVLEEHMVWTQKSGRTFSIVDARLAERPDSTLRAKLAELVKKYDVVEKPKGQRNVTAVVMTSKLVAGAMTAIRWAVPAKNEEGYFSTVMEGLRFLEEHAQKSGVKIPDAFRARVAAMESNARASGA